MSAFLWLVPAVAVALVFLASLAQRAPVRLPRRFAGPHEEGAMRAIHRSFLLHLAATAAALALLLAGRAMSAYGIAVYVACLLGARLAGFAVASRRPELATWAVPLLAPVDGIAMLLDWVLSPFLLRGLQEPPERGSAEEAYEQVLELTQLTVEQMMIPRSAVIWLRSDARIEEIKEALRRRPHTRYPVFEGDFEQFVGMVELVDLLTPLPAGSTAAGLAHPAVVVPETMLCDDLLEKMRLDGFDTAVVVDEFGTFAGLTTREDLLEVLVGDLTGEHENVPVRIQRIEGGEAYQVDAALRIDEFEDAFGTALPEGDYETLAGLFLSRIHRIPGAGEKLTVGDVRMEVIQADARRIRTLKIVFLKPPRRTARFSGVESDREAPLPG
jgi:Mg2+/Co2+ transporter CorC